MSEIFDCLTKCQHISMATWRTCRREGPEQSASGSPPLFTSAMTESQWFRRTECWHRTISAHRAEGSSDPINICHILASKEVPLDIAALPACVLALQAIAYLDPLTRANACAGSLEFALHAVIAVCAVFSLSVVRLEDVPIANLHPFDKTQLFWLLLVDSFCEDTHHWVTTTSKSLFPHCPSFKMSLRFLKIWVKLSPGLLPCLFVPSICLLSWPCFLL